MNQNSLSTLNFFNSLLGNLAWTCPSSVKTFPIVPLMDANECTDNIFLQGMDVDANENIAICGYITITTTTSCPKIRNVAG